MRPRRPTLLFVIPVVVVGLTAAAIAAGGERVVAPRDVALAALEARSGSRCQRLELITLAYDRVDQKIADANSNAGWVANGIFVGDLPAAAAAAKNGELVAEDSSEAWILTPEAGQEQLLGLTPRNVAGKQAFVVTQIVEAC